MLPCDFAVTDFVNLEYEDAERSSRRLMRERGTSTATVEKSRCLHSHLRPFLTIDLTSFASHKRRVLDLGPLILFAELPPTFLY